MNNIVVINKEKDWTSHDVVNKVRGITGERRVGHAGTLDPLATGVLIVLVGRENTKRQDEFMGFSKTYEAQLTFGTISETYDAEGPFMEIATTEQLKQLTQQDVENVLPEFTGTILQRPPAHSAIKIGGQPLYKKARKGQITNEEVPPREVTINALELLSFTSATETSAPTAHLRIYCEKGTYIRSLANDIGQALGVGAYMSELVRTAIGEYTIDKAVTIAEYENLHKNR